MIERIRPRQCRPCQIPRHPRSRFEAAPSRSPACRRARPRRPPACGTRAPPASARPRRLRDGAPRVRTAGTSPSTIARAATTSWRWARAFVREPRPYQTEALAAWRAQQGRGVVVLPTARARPRSPAWPSTTSGAARWSSRPTLDLVRQWYDVLRTTFGGPVGRRRRRRARRAAAHRDDLRLGLPAHGAPRRALRPGRVRRVPPPARDRPTRWRRAPASAPFRLGLTATPERADGRDAELDELIGPIVYRKDIVELSARRLPRRVRDRAPHRRARPRGARGARRGARHLPRLPRAQRHPHVEPRGLVRLHHPRRRAARTGGARWPPTAASARSPSPRPAKLDYVEQLLDRHRDDRALAVHAGQRDRLRGLAALPGPGHHPPDQGARAQRDPRRLRRAAATARSSPRRCSTRASTSPTRTSRSSCRAAARCASTCSASAASCARARASAPCSTSSSPRGRPRPTPASGGGSTVLTADLVTARRRGDELRLIPVDAAPPRAHRGAGGGVLGHRARPRRIDAPAARRRAGRGRGGRGPAQPRPAPHRGGAEARVRRLQLRGARRRDGRRPCAARSSGAPPRSAGRRRRARRSIAARCWRPRRASAGRPPPTSRRGLYADRAGAAAAARVRRPPTRACSPPASSSPRRRRCCCARRA